MSVVLTPKAAVEAICHDDQMIIWTGEVAGALSMGGFLRDLEYHEGIDLNHCIEQELKRILKAAFNHPEAKVIKRNP